MIIKCQQFAKTNTFSLSFHILFSPFLHIFPEDTSKSGFGDGQKWGWTPPKSNCSVFRINCSCTRQQSLSVGLIDLSWWNYHHLRSTWLRYITSVHLMLSRYIWCYLGTFDVTSRRYIWCYLGTFDVTLVHLVLHWYIWCYIGTFDVTLVHSMLHRYIRCYIGTFDVTSVHSMLHW